MGPRQPLLTRPLPVLLLLALLATLTYSNTGLHPTDDRSLPEEDQRAALGPD